MLRVIGTVLALAGLLVVAWGVVSTLRSIKRRAALPPEPYTIDPLPDALPDAHDGP
jgi:hypothetical protein